MSFKIMLKNTEEVEEFVSAASSCPFEIDLKSGSIYIDAKSFLGVLTLGVKREMDVICANSDKKFEKIVKKYAVA